MQTRSCQSGMSAVRLLTGVNRTWHRQPHSVEIDPKETSVGSFGSLLRLVKGALMRRHGSRPTTKRWSWQASSTNPSSSACPSARALE
jgi:hypothetical protein